ncbi:MAG: carboxynorspermidine decarboxylase [Saprospiraceae bacterium]|nr:carboxynorspermidine decarboxylase [Saprospiraceae bacterium]
MPVDYSQFPSPCFILEEEKLRRNLALIHRVQNEAGIEIILAFKAFAMWKAFPIIREYIGGATGSSLHEARLCYEEMKTRAHVYAPVYLRNEFGELMSYASNITFNSLSQWDQFKSELPRSNKPVSAGLRVNPEYSDVKTDLYNPASPYSRLGMTAEHLQDGLPDGVEGLHFHTLCESDSYALEHVLENLETRFGHLLPHVKWVNMGGGHLMTRKGYDIDHLIGLLRAFRQKHDVHIILEPGSAFVWQTGNLLTTIVDIVENNGVKTAMLDVSFTAHMPDTLEMPYRPVITGASDPQMGMPTYRLGGTSCLAGDYHSEYSFPKALHPGDQLILEDMIHYTMVKTTTFNGVKHPSIAMWTADQQARIFRTFTYEDFKNRLS